MKAKVYLETTIPSYLVARQSRDLVIAAHQELTREWWNERREDFNLYVSEPVLKEAGAGNEVLAQKRVELLAAIPILTLTRGILELAESLVVSGPIPKKAAGDALHIAVATVYGCEYLLTWNCRHIANAEITRVAARLVQSQGFELPSICTPEELLGELE